MNKIKKIGSKIKNLGSKIVNVIKKRWLISGTKTILLVAILVALFILITTGMQELDLTPIDLTADKVYTLSDESKERVADIEDQVNIYFIGYSEDDSAMIIAKQYNDANSNINVEAVDLTERVDIAQEYGLDSSSVGIIVESGERSKVLSSSDLYSFDYSTYEYIDLTETKLTSAIITVTTEDIPNVYFLDGYNDIFSLDNYLYYLGVYLENEIMNVDTLDILVEGAVPDDCDTLVITTPTKDFEDIVADAIIDYINNGGNILWFNAAYGIEQDLPNVNRVLELYGIDPFSVGYIMESDSEKSLAGANYMIIPDIEYTEITADIYSSLGVMLTQATKINIDEDSLEDLNVEETDLLIASSTSFFRSDVSITSSSKQEDDEEGEFVVGALLEKTIQEAVETTDEETGETIVESEAIVSELIIYGENFFISDYTISSSSMTPSIAIYNNKDLALNSIAYLTEREQDITIRKTTNDVTYTATEQEDTIVQTIIFVVPCIILLAGIVVWQVRRRKK